MGNMVDHQDYLISQMVMIFPMIQNVSMDFYRIAQRRAAAGGGLRKFNEARWQ
jgi:hypothetical protein